MTAFKIAVPTLALLLLVSFSGCQTVSQPEATNKPQQETTGQTAWLSELIRELEQEQVANPPARVYRYVYNEREVYYLTGRCCDIPGKLYDVEGNVLCEPDGDITGTGDGQCSDFADTRTDETLIWEDKRERL